MKKVQPFVFFLSFLLCLQACKKYDVRGTLREPGVVFTFDDANIDNWYQYLPVLDSMQVKATFYISQYHTLTPLQIKKLKTIASHGHEIGYHTTHHIDIAKYINKYGAYKLQDSEIAPDLDKMRLDGFNPVVFAYPYGSHSPASDVLLLRSFKSVRALNGTTNFAKSLTSTTSETMLYGLGIDNEGAKKDAVYDDLLKSAQENGNSLVLVAHRIEEGNSRLKVSLTRLFHLVNKAKELHLRFYKASEISLK